MLEEENSYIVDMTSSSNDKRTSSDGKRTLAAILFADIVGYTKMMANDEGTTMNKLRHYQTTLKSKIDKFDGEIIKNYGDGSLCVFKSVLNAVLCAKELQLTFQKEPIIPLRIGLHIGDVVYLENDIYGDAINVASRIESMGTPGSVLMSKDIHKKVSNQSQLEFTNLGKYLFKNIEEPIEVFALSNLGLVIPEKKEVKGLVKGKRIKSGKFIFPAIIAVLSLSLIFFIGSYLKKDTNSNLSITNNASLLKEKIAVLHFKNLTGDAKLDVIGPMISHWLTEGFLQNGDIKMVSSNALQQIYQSDKNALTRSGTNLQELLGTRNIIDGSFFLQEDSIFVKSNYINAETGEIIYSFGEFSGHKDKPITIIENLREKVLGYWFTKENIQSFPPPRYDSYKKYIEAQSLWGENDSAVKELLEESIQLDKSFFEPHILLIALLRNKRKWKDCDSLTNALYERKTQLTQPQLERLNFFRHELQGDSPTAYKYLKKEYDRHPDDLFINTSLIQFLSYKLNAHQQVLEIEKEIPIEDIDLENCVYCKTRLFSLVLAAFKLNKQDQINKYIQLNGSLEPDMRIKQIELMNAVRQGDDKTIENNMKAVYDEGNYRLYLEHLILITEEFFSINNKTKSEYWLNKFDQISGKLDQKDELTLELIAQYYEFVDQERKSLKIYENFLAQYPKDRFFTFRKACVLAIQGNKKEALKIANKLESQTPKFDFGRTEYEMGRVHALLGDKEKAIQYLNQSIDNGRQFHHLFFDKDWYLNSIWNSPEFKKLLTKRIPKT